ncbi:hypothetical protein [Pseudonocardia sp. NPDC049154]|uniref:hypothetical protein n=1 Tax=Pseudonocardia sp. NPDC049154 TaxID=3155501 RepID=UPI0033FF0683
MQQVVALPEDLAAMPPGPELAAVLAAIDLAETANEDLPVLLQARYRQVAHEQAGLYEVMAQIAVGAPERWYSAARRARPQKYWSDEVRAALTWTRRAAEYQTELAWVLHAHLPSVAEALRSGVIATGSSRSSSPAPRRRRRAAATPIRARLLRSTRKPGAGPTRLLARAPPPPLGERAIAASVGTAAAPMAASSGMPTPPATGTSTTAVTATVVTSLQARLPLAPLLRQRLRWEHSEMLPWTSPPTTPGGAFMCGLR